MIGRTHAPCHSLHPIGVHLFSIQRDSIRASKAVTPISSRKFVRFLPKFFKLSLFQVTPQAIEEMKQMRDNIDWQKIREEERRLKHDVMAHNHAFGAV